MGAVPKKKKSKGSRGNRRGSGTRYKAKRPQLKAQGTGFVPMHKVTEANPERKGVKFLNK